MHHDNPYYRIDLEDYSYPRHESVLRPYFGTMEDIRTLMNHLSEGQGTAIRYRDTIEAFDRYTLDPETVHTIAGQEMPILTPCIFLHHNQFSVSNPVWLHRSNNGGTFRIKADEVEVDQLLLQQADQIHRCTKLQFHNLGYYTPFIGFVLPDETVFGFPGQIRYPEKNTHSMTLYTHLQTYSTDQCIQALQDVKQLSQRDWSQVCIDMMGGM